ncbi:TPA: SMI1/KNR4 family protein [Vibrio parahaemolyticus]|uniref:SMI1/KNR4 family protein n=1 Tax=Vibrio parahaemolyticus TaxID=670 RepID=UPI0004F3CE55|nr:SMI1/KNR4 family protein [Vibrio parahaemolyticus]EGR1122352.1 SMI1/KNR4 family protein [Vibrio parahaemolyticus]HAS6883046.1 SMI1/KNR4 family protein [Vibrio parahaemolyticus]HCG8849552.1 SMI1/KNR4 family protein [Vibrio parahaemolyticus]HCH2420941.1 SMI1/KNR4 family protein [Vibrio parahaemolyticus]
MFGQIFIDSFGNEYGVIRKVDGAIPEELSGVEVIAEDECGNYFILNKQNVYFWDHETSNSALLTTSITEFKNGCVSQDNVERSEGQVISVWIDPEFSKLYGLKNEP